MFFTILKLKYFSRSNQSVTLTFSERDKSPEIESTILYKCTHCGKVYSNHTSFVKHIKVHDIEEKRRKIEEIEQSRTKEQIDNEVSIL